MKLDDSNKDFERVTDEFYRRETTNFVATLRKVEAMIVGTNMETTWAEAWILNVRARKETLPRYMGRFITRNMYASQNEPILYEKAMKESYGGLLWTGIQEIIGKSVRILNDEQYW